jgi:hypothetical protein
MTGKSKVGDDMTIRGIGRGYQEIPKTFRMELVKAPNVGVEVEGNISTKRLDVCLYLMAGIKTAAKRPHQFRKDVRNAWIICPRHQTLARRHPSMPGLDP